MSFLASLAVFSGFSLNMLLIFALGTAGAASDDFPKTEGRRKLPVFQYAVFFVSLVFLWLFFHHLLPQSWKGFSKYFLLFPVSALACIGLELLFERVFKRFFPAHFSRQGGVKKVFSAYTAYDGLVPVALFFALSLAGSFSGAFVLALFFVMGNMLVMLILNEIRRKSALEWVPRYLRGTPLIIISMGLLSLIFTVAAGICFKILEVF